MRFLRLALRMSGFLRSCRVIEEMIAQGRVGSVTRAIQRVGVDSVVGLREELKERLDSKKIARKHLPQAATAAGVLGLLLGYAAAAVFV